MATRWTADRIQCELAIVMLSTSREAKKKAVDGSLLEESFKSFSSLSLAHLWGIFGAFARVICVSIENLKSIAKHN